MEPIRVSPKVCRKWRLPILSLAHLRLALLVVLPTVLTLAVVDCRAESSSVVTATVCEMARWDESMVGTKVRIKAEYFTDFRHGAFLLDKRCPSQLVQIGVDPEKPDASMLNFDAYVAEHQEYYRGRNFKVEILGLFEWNEKKIVNEELPRDRHLIVPAHGGISTLKIVYFEKFRKDSDHGH